MVADKRNSALCYTTRIAMLAFKIGVVSSAKIARLSLLDGAVIISESVFALVDAFKACEVVANVAFKKK